ncbi:MAG: molecular chaperone TorD family protein [Candidatus Competibacteraceae bacterium]|jgi:TorA maturation chaperone TorD|nr:molecular chaperone TorD family protein [Candidatus Competibacteraceae bacterium]
MNISQLDNPAPEELSERALRAGTYSLLASLLRTVPDQQLLQRLQGIAQESPEPPVDDMSNAWVRLRKAAEEADFEALADEYQSLFIGLGRGELMPYGSWYLTGFLMEKPLAQLRQDLTGLGYERQEGISEPEDHVAALCEVMALLIMDEAVTWEQQQQFFDAHLGSWMETFFHDLEHANSAQFYRPVGYLGREFITLEKRYLAMLV